MLIIASFMVFAGLLCFIIAMNSFKDKDLGILMMIGFAFFLIFSIIPFSMIGK